MEATPTMLDAPPDRGEHRRHRPDLAFSDPAGTPVQPLLPYGVGIDCHSKFIQVCVLAQVKGEVLRFEAEFETTWPQLQAANAWAVLQCERCADPPLKANLRYTIESTGTYHQPVLLAWKGVPSVVNPTLAGPTRRKTDVLDARMLAHHSLIGLWRASFMPERQSEILRILLGMRQEQSRCATRCLNRMNNNLLRFGHTIGREYSMADPYTRGVVEDMCRGIVPDGPTICPDGLPESIREFFTLGFKLYDFHKGLRDEYHKKAKQFICDNTWPQREGRISGKDLLSHLTSVPGVGEVTAITWLSVICDPKRFESAKQVAAFCGADPSLKVSAGKVTSHVKRKGNARLHHALKNVSAQLVRRANNPIGQWGSNIAHRTAKGGWARAINAVSRRLAIFLWQVHLRNDEFSYEQYRFYLAPEVIDVAIEKMDLGPRYTKALKELGLETSSQLSQAFVSTLPQTKGIGAGCLQKVKEWLTGHPKPPEKHRAQTRSTKKSDCASKGKSPGARGETS